MSPSREELLASVVERGEPTTAQAWMGRFLDSQAHVAFNTLWLAFSIGQAGAAMQFAGPEIARELVDRLAGDIDDMEAACTALLGVARDMHANAERNLPPEARS